jgi:AmmeMemoRadiSam system protein B/AmmeMemoRadiSam system protein A
MNERFRRFCILVSVLLINYGCNSQISDNQAPLVDRPTYAAERFYPSNPSALKARLALLFKEAKPGEAGNVVAIISPHAGYDYSGVVAASAFNQVDPEKRYDNIFIIASSHQVAFEGASIYNRGDYLTPLGKVKVNRELANALIQANVGFSYHPGADVNEHSLEVQLPFLQYRLKNEFHIVPIVLGTQTPTTCKKLAAALQPYLNEKNLFVISTDFSHYPTDTEAKKLDKESCDAIVANSSSQLLKNLRQHETEPIENLVTSMCGWTSVLTLLEMTGSGNDFTYRAIDYKNSGDAKAGNKSQVVGYWAIAVSQAEPVPLPSAFSLSHSEKAELLKIARNTMSLYVQSKRTPEINPKQLSKNLTTQLGAFVTIKEKGELRGCIGRFIADQPLYQVIQNMAIAAATQDPRFDPVTSSEVEKVEIEISVLSPLQRIKSIDEIILGKHGIYLKSGMANGTFLPQVATETGWTKEEFLGHCSRDKAGLGWDGWKRAEIYVYTAEVFSEKEINARKD